VLSHTGEYTALLLSTLTLTNTNHGILDILTLPVSFPFY
jgi:hypothetical protein